MAHTTSVPPLDAVRSGGDPPTEPALPVEVRPWPDPVIDRRGHDTCSVYVERFWLPVLGPSTTFLFRLLGRRLGDEPEGFGLDTAETSQALGLGTATGRHAAFPRAVKRMITFGLARSSGTALEVRRHAPPLSQRQLRRLTDDRRAEHDAWQRAELTRPDVEELRDRGRRLALSLFELGAEPDAVERELHRWEYHPAMAADAMRWARDRHRVAEIAARRGEARP